MGRPERTEKRQEKVTIYFDKRAFEEQEKEEKELEEKQKNKEEAVKAAVAFIAFFVKPAIIMLLWNWLLPGIFGLATIGYFKALGLYLLARLFIDKE
jgi:F0F1-type ATP synthase assembly protein I|tara:strand:- start:156 stop:446 length:291 start_codon:yes stop_codon:yes gene_type:complete